MSQRLRVIASAVMIGLGLWLALPHQPGSGIWVFALASLVAVGTRLGLALAALALLAGLAAEPVEQALGSLNGAAMALSGVGLGLLARELERLHTRLESPLVLGALLAIVLSLTLALPDGSVTLATAEGGVMSLPAMVVDGASFMRRQVELPALVELAAPVGSSSAIALTAALLAVIVLVIAHLRHADAHDGSRHLRRGAWELAALAAGLALVTAVLGLAQLLGLFGPVALDPEGLRRGFDLAASPDGGVLDLAVPASAELRLWSRPWVDGLRLLAAVSLVALAIRQLLRSPTPDVSLPGISTRPELSSLPYVALASTTGATAFIAAANGLEGAPLALLAGLVLGVGTLASRASGARPTGVLTAAVALSGCGLAWIYAWLVGPLFGA